MKTRKMKLTAFILALALGAGLVFSGCGNRQEEEETESVVAEIVILDEADSDNAAIGDTSASLDIKMTNEMGSTITGLAVKSPSATSYPGNMMTADQQIANDQTVDFYFEPKDADFSGTALLPSATDVGYWNVTGDTEAELNIINISGNTVTFSLWWNRLADTDNITAELDDQNIGSFTGQVNDVSLEGRIAFYDGSVVVSIDECALDRIPQGTTVFDERHDTSWQLEGTPDSTDSEEEEDEEQEETAAAILNPTAEDETFSLQVTMDNRSVYELYGFDVEDMSEVTLYLEGGIPYMEYMSLTTNTLVSTKSLQTQIKQDKEAAQKVIDMINALGTITESNAQDMEEQITAARAAYDALTSSQKAYVTNLSLLVEKESLLADVSYDEEDYSYDYNDYEEDTTYDYDEEEDNSYDYDEEDNSYDDNGDYEEEYNDNEDEQQENNYDDGSEEETEPQHEDEDSPY